MNEEYAGEGDFGYETYGEGEILGDIFGEYAGTMQEEYGHEVFSGEVGFEEEFSQNEEMALAAELLSLNSEEELDQFFGKIFRAVKSAASSPVGQALGGMLKGVAKKALPMVGGALGSMVAPGVGTALGSQLGSMAGRLFGLEIEGLSGEDRDFESARRVVRLSKAAAKTASKLPVRGNPVATAKTALKIAAKKHAPGLVGVHTGAVAPAYRKCSSGGRWVRRGNTVVLYGI